MNTTFEPGKTYSTRSICDHNCIFSIKVLSRTAKTLKVIDPFNKPKTLRVSVWGDVEQVKPLGSYSMAPVIGAYS